MISEVLRPQSVQCFVIIIVLVGSLLQIRRADIDMAIDLDGIAVTPSSHLDWQTVVQLLGNSGRSEESSTGARVTSLLELPSETIFAMDPSKSIPLREPRASLSHTKPSRTTNENNVVTSSTLPESAENKANPKQKQQLKEEHRSRIFNNSSLDSMPIGNVTVTNETSSAVICSIVRDENRYLKEWALYHLALGFEKLYLYDNSEHGSLESWLQEPPQRKNPALQHGIHAHSFRTKDKRRQLKAFRDCIRRFGGFHTWVALYDPDEFLVLKQHDTVVEMLKSHCPDGSLGINWMVFGTSNQTHYQNQPVTRRFQHHLGVDAHVKTIVKTSDYLGQKSAHWVNLKDPKTRRDTDGKWIQGKKLAGVHNPTFHPKGPVDVAAVYHYKYKSLEEFNAKGCSRGYVWNQKRCFNQTLDELPAGRIHDDAAWRLFQRLVPNFGEDTSGQS